MNETQFYDLWTKFANSDLLESLPDDVEEFCAENEITVDYFIKSLFKSSVPVRKVAQGCLRTPGIRAILKHIKENY